MKTPPKTSNNKKTGWKRKFIAEMKGYLINVIYLAIFFGVFTWYRRLILAEHQIAYLEYGTSLIEALILGKVIMIGDIMRLGKRLEDKPLIIPTLYKSVVFTVFVGLFTIIEHAIRGIIAGEGAAGGIKELMSKDLDEFLIRNLIIFFAFVPFFAFKELERILGEHKIWQLFFHTNSNSNSKDFDY